MLGKMKIIALCTSRIYDDNCTELITSLNNELVKRGGRLFVFSTISDLFFGTEAEDGESSVFRLMNFSMIDAVIVHADALKDGEVLENLVSKVYSAGKPIFYIGKAHEKCVNFTFDYKKGFEKVVRHVVEFHKTKSIHMIAGLKDNIFSDERIDIFKKVIEENNIPFDDSMLSYGDFWAVPTEKAICKLVEEKRVPKAVICANDSMAITAALALKNNGYRVPEDVIVTGFDGIVDARFNEPKITTVFCSYSRLGKMIVSAIYDKFDGKKLQNEYLIEPVLQPARSCGCYGNETDPVSEYISSMTKRFYSFQEDDKRLNRISLRIQGCTKIDQIGKILDDQTLLYDMACIVDDDFVDPTLNPMDDTSHEIMEQTAHAIYKSGRNSELRTEITVFPLKELYHDLENFADGLKAPLIFNALAYRCNPFGYVCYFYKDCFKDNYAKTLQITLTLCSALSGFRAARYQRYLLEHIEESYRRDTLTGLYNRRGFIQMFPEFKKSCGSIMTAVLADLDDLKGLNDNHGHDEGDVAIRAVAQALMNSCPEDSVCVRFGGDEMFAVIKGRADDEIRVKINDRLSDFNAKSGKPYTVSASVGIYTTDSDDATFEELVRKSDQLMYNEKIAKKIKR